MGRDRFRRRLKAVSLLIAGVLIGITMTAMPATAHVTSSVPHLIQHLKKTFFTKAKANERFVAKRFGNFDGDDGSLVRGRGVVSSQRAGEGFYTITFNRNIENCVLVASPSSIDSVNPSSVTVGAAYYSPTPRTAFVLIREDFADNRIDADFSLAALC